MEKPLPPLFLASQSPRRRQLLSELRLRFSVFVSKLEEPEAPKIRSTSPEMIVKKIAQHKLCSVLPELELELKGQGEAYVIAADTLVFQGKKVLGKPKDPTEAKQMLRTLRGKNHTVATAVAIGAWKKGKWKIHETVVKSRVQFSHYPLDWIDWYVATGEPLDKAGAYGAQGAGTVLIEKISGSYTNIVGLPLAETVELLAKSSGRKWQEWCDGN